MTLLLISEYAREVIEIHLGDEVWAASHLLHVPDAEKIS
jgi:hypothetical protein